MLSEEKIVELLKACPQEDHTQEGWIWKQRIAWARAIEAAVLEEQAKAEPMAWLFQHEETGQTMCVDTQQVEWGFEKNNPRLQKIAPLYIHPSHEPEGMVLVQREVLNQCLPIIEAAINRAVKENFGRCDENAHKYIDLLDAMIAAAEKESGKC